MLTTGFIGLGAMGAPMAGHIASAGLLHTVWNRSPDKARQFAARYNVTASQSPAALAEACDVVLICVSADQDVEQIFAALQPHLRPQAIVVDHSTVAPQTSRNMAAALSGSGHGFLDAPVSGGVEGANNGCLSVMVGGSSEVLARVRPIMDCYAARINHMGAAGNGQATKAVNQILVAGIAEAVCEGLALAERLELPYPALLQVLQSGAAGSWFLEKRGATMLADDCDIGFKLELLIKDLHICEQIAADKGLRLPGIQRALHDYLQCQQAGDGQQDISALIRLKRT